MFVDVEDVKKITIDEHTKILGIGVSDFPNYLKTNRTPLVTFLPKVEHHIRMAIKDVAEKVEGKINNEFTYEQVKEVKKMLAMFHAYAHIINKVFKLGLREDRKIRLSTSRWFSISEIEILIKKVNSCDKLFELIYQIENKDVL